MSTEAGQTIAWISALEGYLDFKRIPIGTGFRVGRNSDQTPQVLQVRAERDRWLSLEQQTDHWVVKEHLVDYQITERSASVSLQHSVSEAMGDQPFGAALTSAFAEVLQWDVDLFVDPRPGDHVAMVYTEQTPLPGDRPLFRNQEDVPALGELLAVAYYGERAEAQAFKITDSAETVQWYDLEGQPMKKAFLKSPLNYTRISSGFSKARRHPITRKVIPHHGVDFAAPHGTPVSATGDGSVIKAGWQGALGKAVTIRHPNGYETIYGHLSRVAKDIKVGVRVQQNQLVGYVGKTGRATGNHLHYTMKLNGRAIDPMKLKIPKSTPILAEDRPKLDRAAGRHLPTLRAGLEQPIDLAEQRSEHVRNELPRH